MTLTNEIRELIGKKAEELSKKTGIHIIVLKNCASTDPVFQRKFMSDEIWNEIYPWLEKDLADDVFLYPKSKLLRYARCWQKHLQDKRKAPPTTHKQWWGGSYC